MRFGSHRGLFVVAVLASSVVGTRAQLAREPVGASAGRVASIQSIGAGAYNGYAILSNGEVWAWGDDYEGQTGDTGPRSVRTVPVEVRGLPGAVFVAGGANSVYALTSDGTVWAWGDDSEGELGDVRSADAQIPRLIADLTAVRRIAAGSFSAYAIRSEGTAWAWGDNGFGQLGTSSPTADFSLAKQLPRIADVVAVAAGTSDGYALLGNGTVWAWGADSARQLGGGKCATTTIPPRGICLPSNVPHKVQDLSDVVAIAAGGNSGYALRRDGTVWAWGDDECGELGNGVRRLDEAVPVRVIGLSNVDAIAAGACSAYALLRNGTVWAWGNGEYGELGDGEYSTRSVPVQVKGLSDVEQVAAGGAMAYALERNGSLWAWGDDAYGQLGNDSLFSRDLPVRVLGLPGSTRSS